MKRMIRATAVWALHRGRRIVLAGIARLQIAGFFIVAAAAPAQAAQCINPIPPAAVDGSTATEQQMEYAIKDFKNYQAASDDYQACLVAQLKQEKQAAANGSPPRPIDPAMLTSINSEISANQQMKEQIGNQLNAQIGVFKRMHPGS